MSCTVNSILNEARKHVGIKEGSSKHHYIIDTYNAHKPLARGYKVKYSDNWCATFISLVAIKCGATDIIPTECSCGKMIELMKNKGIWVEDDNITPKIGDIIMYDWDKKDGWPEHVGIVEKVSGSTITVIEGNKNNAVSRRTITVGNASIRGYGRPKYKAEPKPTPPTPQPSKPSKPSYKVGRTYTLQTEMKVRTGAGTNYRAKKHSELTSDGRKHDGDKDGALSKGTRVTCKAVVNKGDEIWLKTPSGYICAYQNGKTYIK